MLLGRRDRADARGRLRRFSAEEQARACSELRAELRSEFLMLCDCPEEVVPLWAEAERLGIPVGFASRAQFAHWTVSRSSGVRDLIRGKKGPSFASHLHRR